MSMSAKELHEWATAMEESAYADYHYKGAKALRSYASLLDSVESSGDELVRALGAYQQASEDGVMVMVSRQACDEAAARIVSDAREKAALKVELAGVKAHAEAMHEEIEKLRSYLARLHGGETIRSAPADAYRSGWTKEGA